VNRFGTLLRDARKSLGLTLSQASNATSMSMTHLSDIERGRRQLGIGRVPLVAIALRIDQSVAMTARLQDELDDASVFMTVTVK
jgi:transcriptional regulator with XRE-family HTH domain